MNPPLYAQYHRLAPQDNNGSIRKSEVIGAADKVSKEVGLKEAPKPAVNMIFDKVRFGPRRQVLSHVGKVEHGV